MNCSLSILDFTVKDAGEIWVHGQPIEIRSPRDAKRHGIGFVTEDRKEEGPDVDPANIDAMFRAIKQ